MSACAYATSSTMNPRAHTDAAAQKIRHPRNVRILPPSRGFIEGVARACRHAVIASEAKQSRLSARQNSGLLRFARNDEFAERSCATLSVWIARLRGR
jgi:hypothetical protein